jgi:uncharacterized protein YrrD
MNATKLRGMPVVSIQTAERLGEVRDILVDTSSQRLVALELKQGSSSTGETVPVEDIYSVGKDAITLREERTASSLSEEDPGHEELRAGRPEGVVALKKLQGAKALSFSGNLLGTISDLEVDPATFEITAYELGSGGLAGLTGGHKRLHATPDSRFLNDILMVPDTAQMTSGDRSREIDAARDRVQHPGPE